ncbi:MAG: hypothetical protein PHW13_10420 [Methylococcales bacterium]|nr:hypothetical protein [Methylococcales bacterium]
MGGRGQFPNPGNVSVSAVWRWCSPIIKAKASETSITEDFVKQLAARQPLRVVFRDAGFASDSVKINVEQIFKLLSPSTDIKTL